MEKELSQRINLPQVKAIAEQASGDGSRLGKLWEMACGQDRRTAVNALWVMTHLPEADSSWIKARRREMIDMLLGETDTAKKRMLLTLLREQEYTADDIPTDLLDYCLAKINAESEPYAIRCFSIYTAFKMCRHYPELLAELSAHLAMLSHQPLSPGLASALRQTQSRLPRLP